MGQSKPYSGSQMVYTHEHGAVEKIMDLLEVRIDTFSAFEIDGTGRLHFSDIDNIIVHLVLSGEGACHFGDISYHLTPKTVLIAPRLQSHTITGKSPAKSRADAEKQWSAIDHMGRFKIGDSPDLLIASAAIKVEVGGLLDVFEHLWEPIFEDSPDIALEHLSALAEHELATQSLGARAMIGALVKQVLISTFRAQLRREPFRTWLWPAMMDKQLGKAALAIMASPSESHTIESLSEHAGMSRSSFIGQFSDAFGRSPMEFVLAVRLKAAERLLTHSTLPVKTVASAVGFASRSHFSRSFTARFGVGPSSYRKSGADEA